MIKIEYDEYQRSFAAFLEREGIDGFSTGSLEHNYENPCESEDHSHDENGDFYEDPFFSWSYCDCCQRPLGGNRHTCIAYNPTTKQVQGDYAICEDCIYFNEYGQLDDMTMLDMES